MPPRWGFGVFFVTILELFHPFGVTIMSPRRGWVESFFYYNSSIIPPRWGWKSFFHYNSSILPSRWGWESFFDYNSSIMPPRWGLGIVF